MQKPNHIICLITQVYEILIQKNKVLYNFFKFNTNNNSTFYRIHLIVLKLKFWSNFTKLLTIKVNINFFLNSVNFFWANFKTCHEIDYFYEIFTKKVFFYKNH